MSALAGLSLEDILGKQKKPVESAQQQITQFTPKAPSIIDIIKNDETNNKDRRSWKAFKDKLRLKRAGSAWQSTIQIPTSDIPIPHPNSRTYTQFGRRNSVRFQTHPNSDESTQNMEAHQPEDPADFSRSPAPALATRAQFSRKSSTRFGAPVDAFTAGDPTDPGPALRPQLSRRNSTNINNTEPYRRGRVVTFRDSFDDDEPDEEDGSRSGRALSAREAVAAQEAAEAAAAQDEEEEEGEEGGQPMTMSLMDLLEETDREMGLEGSRYILSDDEFDEEEEEEDGEVDEDGEGGGMEFTCSVCMVRHKANAISTCGHSYCRMCSRELMVNKGNCPLCNKFVVEILEIF